MGNVVNQLAFPAPDPRYSQPLLEAREDTIWLRTQKAKIVAVDLRNAKRSEQAYNGVEYVILYSHGNAEDVGLALPYLEELARITDCSVFAYEYEGYKYIRHSILSDFVIFLKYVSLLFLAGVQ